MRVGLVAVGDELLAGLVTNRNAAWLGRTLTAAGFEVVREVTVGDDVEAVADAVAVTLRHADALVLTGGLGPTSDDRTRDALAAVAGAPLVRDPALLDGLTAWFAARGRDLPDGARRQADVPTGASPLPNPTGSAPGLRVDLADGLVLAVPGVPREMEAMVTESVLPALRERAGPGPAPVVRTLRTTGAGESEVAALLAPVEEHLGAEGRGDVALAYLASPGEVVVRFTGRGDATDLTARVDALAARARAALGDLVYGEGDDTLAVVVHRLLAERTATLAVAESLTGGLLGATLTDVPGASTTFRGGVTAYATPLKGTLLGVEAGLLAREGPVHPEVARAMAAGVRERLGATYGAATTGVAGPEPQGDVPVGTMDVAVAGPDGVRAVRLQRTGLREVLRGHAVAGALDLVRREVLSLGLPGERESAR